MPGQHALLSPSGADRWLNCTRSARLEQQFPESSGQAAAEGILAHALAEVMLGEKTGQLNKLQAKAKYRDIEKDPLYQAEMKDFIGDYASFVMERFSEAQARTRDARIFLEHKLDLTEYVPEGFGTSDVVIIADGIMETIDLKYGKGVPVFADNNKQMMLYALGALLDFDFMYDIRTVRTTIHQPRLDSVSTWEIEVSDLRAWAETELMPRARLAFDGAGDFVPGKHCRFCKAKGQCKANADYNMELARFDFKEPELLTDDEVVHILWRGDLFTKWLKGIEDYALDQAVNGKQWPGMKLVEGRSNRQYGDVEAVEQRLLAAKCWTPEQIYTPRQLLGITALEKAIGKASFAETVADLLIKPPGKPTLVPANDKRPEYRGAADAASDFAEVIA